jgi:cysteine-rich repeat protein
MRRLFGIAVIACGCGPLVVLGDESSGAGDDATTGVISSTTAVTSVGTSVPDTSASTDPTTVSETGVVDEGPITTTTVDTSGEPANCGDGIVDPDEACDDGNDFDDDGCTSACMLTVVAQWTWTFDGLASSFDEANDVIVAPDGSVYVVGSTRSAGAPDVWLQQLSPDGVPGWTWTWDGAEALSDEGAAVAWTPSGALAIVGTTESMATGDDVLVLLFDPLSQSPLWTQVIDGPGSGAGEYDEVDKGHDVAIDPSGNVVVAATVRAGPSDYDAWVGELSPVDGTIAWAQERNLGGTDDAHALSVNDFGQVALTIETDSDEAGVTIFFGDDGSDLAVELDHSFGARDQALRPDGGYALVGTRNGMGYGTHLVVATLDMLLDPFWEDEANGSHNDAYGGVAVSFDAQVAAVGTIGEQGEQGNAWIRVYRSDGVQLWSDSYDGPASLGDVFNAATFDPAGAVIAVGSETAIGRQTNALVRKYVTP